MMQTQVEGDPKQRRNMKNRVRVAVRVRPMINKQSTINENSCIEYLQNNKIIIGKDRCFVFDHVFSQRTMQVEVYEKCVRDLVLSCFEGYNAAVLAYGQTGSGKTYTMGTGSCDVQDQQQYGIIPRVIRQIFQQIDQRKQLTTTILKISFIQIYNQQIIDLLTSPTGLQNSPDLLKNAKHSLSKDTASMPTIREEKDGSISLVNVVEQVVTDCEQMMGLLHRGGANRSTSSTLMNDCSSRSHGIFTIYIEQHPISEVEDQGFITAKFYFVDLAGSERAKKTGASGLTLKQGININLGLLELGNVISALSSNQRKEGQFITYRNSKLTRILQDCLGGNSNTYMISCISPAQSNYQQSLNTIKYATKAMNIKNKPIINRDPHSAQINALKQRIMELENENKSYKKLLSESGIPVPQERKADARSDILTQQLKKLRSKLSESQLKIDMLENQVKQKSKRRNQLQIQNYELKRDRDRFKLKMEKSMHQKGLTVIDEQNYEDQQYGLIEEYQNKIRNLQMELFEQERINNQLQQEYEKLGKDMQKDQQIITMKNKEILKLKSNIKSMLNQYRQSNGEESQFYSKSQPTQQIKDIYQQNLNSSIEQNNNQSYSDKDSSENMEQIEENVDILEAEADFRANSDVQKEKLQQVENQIRERQRKLKDMTEDQINLQYQLISEMKQEYHSKIITLEKQKQFLKKQQEQMAGYEKNPKLLQKIQNLQQELRNLRKKAKDQNTLQKQVALQSQQIKNLANEIKAQKVQKIQINRKIKEDKNAFDKFRKQKIKQILYAKKENVKKDKEIRKLALENKRKSMQMKKKVDQLNKAKRVNEAIKSYNKNNKKISHKTNIYSHQQKGNKNLFEQSHDSIYEQMQTINNKAIEQICVQQELKLEMDRFDKKIVQLEAEIQKIIEERARLQMKLDRIEICANYSGEESSEKKIEIGQLSSKLSQLNERVDVMEQNIKFCQHRYNQLGDKLPSFHEQADLINNSTINTIPKLQAIIKLTYKSLRSFISNNIVNSRNLDYLSGQNQQLKQQIERKRQELACAINQHQINLARFREEMMARYYSNLEEQQASQAMMGNNLGNFIGRANNNANLSLNMSQRIDERERKNFERKIIDLTKINRQLSSDVEMWRRKCSVIQDKYHNANARMAKDKFIGRPREQDISLKKGGNGWNIGGVNSSNNLKTNQMMEQINQMIEKMDNRKKVSTLSQEQQMQQMNRNSQDAQFTKNRWQCVYTLKASRSPILSMATLDNILVTSGTKTINIWDQQTCQLIADLSNPNFLQGFVKSVIMVPEFSLISAACEKQVYIWDIRSYSEVAVLKNHKDEVRCLYSVGNLLFTAGKGSAGGGSLIMWDLRMIRENQVPIDEKQKNIDIFALTSHDKTLYYGTRNHQVRRMTIENREVLNPFQPPHMDTITSLTVINNYLVSGSKDKNLKLWALDGSTNNLKCTTHAFNDYVNTLQTDKTIPIFYSGSRDGQVKMATVVEEKIKFVGGIIAHTQSVSCISSIGKRSHGMFLTGSTDKTVKFWKPDSSTSQRLKENVNDFY